MFDLPSHPATAPRKSRRDALRAMLGIGAAGAVAASSKPALGSLAAPAIAPIGHPGRSLGTAIRLTMMADSELMSQLPGGIWHDKAPRGVLNAYGAFGVYRIANMCDDGGKDYPCQFRNRTVLMFSAYSEDSFRSFRSVASAESLLNGRTIRHAGGAVTIPQFNHLIRTTNSGFGGPIHVATLDWTLDLAG